MNERTVEILRTFLTVVGILALVVFGSRAAAQARNMKLAGANHQSIFAVGSDIMSVLGLTKTEPVKVYEPKPMVAHLPAPVQTVTPIAVATVPPHQAVTPASHAQSLQATTDTAQMNSATGLNNAAGSVKRVTNKVQKTVTNVTDALTGNNSNDFTNLWP